MQALSANRFGVGRNERDRDKSRFHVGAYREVLTMKSIRVCCKIYIGVLADYNSGRLHGGWIDCEGKDADELQEEVNGFLRTSHYPNVLVNCPHIGEALPGKCPVCGSDIPETEEHKQIPSAEEFAIHDSEGFYGLLSENSSLSDVETLAELISEYGEAYALYAGYLGGDSLPTAAQFEDAYRGTYDTFQAYAEEFVEETGLLSEMPENLRGYFDMEAYARDLSQDYIAVDTSSHDVAVFSNT